MAISETDVVNAEKLAIDEINAAGGILGKRIEPVVEDGASDSSTFAEKAIKLIDQDKVPVVFGGWTSASRKAMLPVFEARDHMLWYPIQYEGQECSKAIFYTGAAPNQQAEPAVDWLLQNKGRQFYLVGSDYIYPRTTNTIIKEQLKAKGGQTVGEDYLLLGNTEVMPIITRIKTALPNGGVIVNTLNGDSNVAFFKQLKATGLTPDKYAIMSFSIAEVEVAQIGPEYLQGTFATWNYFQTLDTPENKKFVEAYKTKFGSDKVTDDPIEAAYIAVYLWKTAVEKAKTFDTTKVREAAIGIGLQAPEGSVKLFPNHHISKTVLIGEVQGDGMFKLLYKDPKSPVAPQPWNQYVPETKGYSCDWSPGGKGGKFRKSGP